MKKSLYSSLFIIFTLLLVAMPTAATPLYNYDVKVDPKSISVGKIMDIPLYMVENRDASEDSRWEGGYIWSLTCTFYGGTSEIISFTPREEFNDEDTYVSIRSDGSHATLSLKSDHDLLFVPNAGGVPTEVDNSGITGRSETFLGMLRIKIGAEIQREDGEGGMGPVEIFQLHFGYQKNTDLPWVMKKTSPTDSITQSAMLTKENAVVIFKSDAQDDVEEEMPTPTPNPAVDAPTPPPADTEISATQDLTDTIASSKDLISMIKKKLNKSNRAEQLQLRASLRDLAKYIVDFVSLNSEEINISSAKFNITKASKKAARKLKLFAKKKKKAFKKRKKQALKSLSQIESKLVFE